MGNEVGCAVLDCLLLLPGAAELTNARKAKGETAVFGYFRTGRYLVAILCRRGDACGLAAPWQGKPAFDVFDAAGVNRRDVVTRRGRAKVRWAMSSRPRPGQGCSCFC